MGIVFIILSLVVLGIGLFLVFKILKWVSRKKVRVVWVFSLLAAFAVIIAVNKVFFMKMEFIQSQVYPDLFLIKNPDENRDLANKAVKEMLIQKIDDQAKQTSEVSNLRFYEYSKGDWGESGTAYFLEHKERRDGMTAELLEYYPEYLIAEYTLQPCNEGSDNLGKLDYYSNSQIIKTDTLLNSCK